VRGLAGELGDEAVTKSQVVAGLLACAVCCASMVRGEARAQAPTVQSAAKRTSFGQANLEGTWASNFILNMEATPQTPVLTVPEAQAKKIAAAFAAAIADGFDKALDPEIPGLIKLTDGLPIVRGERRTRAVVEPADGMLPYTPEARKEAEAPLGSASFDNPENRPDGERCLAGLGPPPITTTIYANRLQILQTHDHIVLHTEYGDEVRIIPFADKHGPKMFYSRLGDSIAHWEGATLVIETIGMPDNDRIHLFPTLLVPREGKVIERLTRVSERELLYEFTVVDPMTYAKPWRAEFSWYRTKQPMFEHACHEGNYALPDILAGARYEEAVAKAAAEVARP